MFFVKKKIINKPRMKYMNVMQKKILMKNKEKYSSKEKEKEKMHGCKRVF